LTVVTALGPVTFQRVYFTCFACSEGDYPLDQRLGIDGYLTRQATRLACRAGAQHSFAEAEKLLADLCGWSISDERLRQACHAEAARVSAFREQDAGLATDFAKAAGDIEFQTDASKVNTDMGWRDMKIGIFAKRPRGDSALPEQWDKRDLPSPSFRVAVAAIEEIETFAPRWRKWAKRLNIEAFTSITVLGDGAEWIWNRAVEQFPGSRGVLDIFHASEKIADAAKAVFGEGTEAARSWFEASRLALLKDGWWGLCGSIGAALAGNPSGEGRAALEELTNYFAKQTEHVNYSLRLHRGQSIGSGMVEGAAKNLIGRRIKQTGARWTVANANKMAELCSLSYSNLWDRYWLAA
jgi:hypothetical protein